MILHQRSKTFDAIFLENLSLTIPLFEGVCRASTKKWINVCVWGGGGGEWRYPLFAESNYQSVSLLVHGCVRGERKKTAHSLPLVG